MTPDPLPKPRTRPFRDVGTETLKRLAKDHKNADAAGRCLGSHNINQPRPVSPCDMRQWAVDELKERRETAN